MHYGHPDVFDRVFHLTRGGISKASRGINLSEDIFAGSLTFKHFTASASRLISRGVLILHWIKHFISFFSLLQSFALEIQLPHFDLFMWY
jgi:hypothetical protein